MRRSTPLTLTIVSCLLLTTACTEAEGKNDATNMQTSSNNGSTNNTTGATNSGSNGATNGTTNGSNNATNAGTNNANTNGATNNATTVDCGAVTFEGTCTSATALQYCDDEVGVVEYDCTSDFGAAATCADFAGWGADCVVPEGDSCEIWDASTGEYYNVYCAGTDAACVWRNSDSATCETGFGPACNPATFAEACFGNVYLYDCYIDHPVGADCVALGGLCGDPGCIMPMGAPCDDVVLLCSAGLTCNIAVGAGLGTCE